MNTPISSNNQTPTVDAPPVSPRYSGKVQAVIGLSLGAFGLILVAMMFSVSDHSHSASFASLQDTISAVVLAILIGLAIVVLNGIGMVLSGVACCRPDTRALGAVGIILNGLPVALTAMAIEMAVN
jgi:hypothetical protein